jgi:transglutaminase-like putative cysteine protease
MTLNRRMTVTVAVAVVLVSTVMYPLFAFSAWFYAGIGAAAVVAACGALSRLRVLPVAVCLAISLVGLLYYLTVLFEARHCLLRFIPTAAALRSLWDLAVTGTADAHHYAPPAQQTPGLVLLAASGIGITAVLTDLIAVRLRSTALAGLPLLVLFTVPVTMNAPSGAGTVIVFSLGTAGYLAMLSADGRERIRMWGRLVSLWRSGPLHDAPSGPGQRGQGRPPVMRGEGSGPDTRALAAAGRRVGLASVVLALAVPLILPGLRPGRPFASGAGIGGHGGGTVAAAAPDPLTQTLTELQETHPYHVLSYTTTASQSLQDNDSLYLQQDVLDYLGDDGWQPLSYYAGAVETGDYQGSVPGLSVFSAAQQVTTTVSVVKGQLTSGSLPTFLPAPYAPLSVKGLSGVWLIDPELTMFSATDSADVGSYRVTSLAVDPTEGELNSAPLPPSTGLQADLQLPSSYRIPALEQIADRETAGAVTEYEKVKELADWLSGNDFTYDTAGKTFDTPDGLLDYLTKTRIGVCVQAAYAMTVLTRLLGIPARLVTGYTAGTREGKDSYLVKSTDGHAWTEVYFSGYGWILFEATPAGQGTSHRPSYMGTPAGSGVLKTPPPSSPTPASSPRSPGGVSPFRRVPPLGGGTFTGQAAKPGGSGWAAIVLAVLAAIALACGIIAIVAPPAHRVLTAHTETPRRRPVTTLTAAVAAAVAAAVVVLAFYRVLSHAGIDLRTGWAPVGIAFGAACAFVLVAPVTCRIVLRRWRWALAKDDASRAHAAWREFRDDLADLGVGAQPSEPPRTLAGRVTAGLPEPAREAVRRLALAEERASYAARPAESAGLRRDGAVARRGVAASTRRGARWRALIFPASVLTAAADGAAMIPDQVGALISRRAAERRQVS